MAIAVGERVTASSVNEEIQAPTSALPLGLLPNGYGVRTTVRAITTVEAPVLRLDNIQLYAGRDVRIWVPRVRFDAATNTDRQHARLRIALGGGLATTASTYVARCELDDACSGSFAVKYASASNQLLSVLLSGVTVVGSSVTNMMCTDEGGCEIFVEDMGLTQPDTGTDL
jgi:hypothetical protein